MPCLNPSTNFTSFGAQFPQLAYGSHNLHHPSARDDEPVAEVNGAIEAGYLVPCSRVAAMTGTMRPQVIEASFTALWLILVLMVIVTFKALYPKGDWS